MRLLVIGHTAHYRTGDSLVGWGPTVKEVNWLAKAFDSVTHLACLHTGPAPASALPYETDRICFVGVPPAGGLTISQKLRAIILAPLYCVAVFKEIRKADVIQIRTPGILGMVALVVVSLLSKKPRWTKYAGNWRESGPMPLSFRFQRGWLQHGFSRGPVAINGRWPEQPSFIFPFLNPSLTLDEINRARQEITNKVLSSPIRLVFAGRIETPKGAMVTIEIARNLARHIPVCLDMLGDGPDFALCQAKVVEYGMQNQVLFHGWVTQDTVKEYLSQAHFVLLPSASEGWPKVLSEGMAYGAVPVASRVSAIPQVLEQFQAGLTFPPTDVSGYTQTILETIQQPDRWKALSAAGVRAAPWFSYEKYLIELDEMLASYYGSHLLYPPMITTFRHRFQEAVR